MSRADYPPFDLASVHTYPLLSRSSKVSVDAFARTPHKGASFSQFLDSLPPILGARDFREVVQRIVAARHAGKPVILGMGAHVIKVGMSPIVIHLLQTGSVTAVAMNGAGIVHDFEIAYAGFTSEDVDATLSEGEFGMADETGRLLNDAISEGVRKGYGLGRSVGSYLNSLKPMNLEIGRASCRERVYVLV